MAIFDFSRWRPPPSWIFLDFQNVEILGAGRLKTAKMRHHAKFRGDRLNRCWDMAIFRFFKMAAEEHLMH